MKKDHRFSSLAVLVGLVLCIVASPVDARSVAGMGAFQPIPTFGSQGCIREFFGTALNSCGVTVSDMIFNTQFDNLGGGAKTISVCQRGGSSNFNFSCRAENIASTGEGSFFVAGATGNFTVNTSCTSFTVNQVFVGFLRLHCFNVPANAGIASLSWAP